ARSEPREVLPPTKRASTRHSSPHSSGPAGVRSREHEIDLPPVLLRGGALARPVGRVIQHVGYLRRPEAADVTVEDVALDGRVESGCPARLIRFPAGREEGGASQRKMRPERRLLQRDDVVLLIRYV